MGIFSSRAIVSTYLGVVYEPSNSLTYFIPIYEPLTILVLFWFEKTKSLDW